MYKGSAIPHLPLFTVDVAILETLQNGPKTQAVVINDLLEQSGEGYLYSRIRMLARRGYLSKEKQIPGILLTITEKGTAALKAEPRGGMLYAV